MGTADLLLEGAQPSAMIKTSNNRPMALFSLFMATTTLASGTTGAVTIPAEPSPTILETIVSTVSDSVSDATDGLDDEMELCAAKIDAYYNKQKVPLAGYGSVFAQAAIENGADCEIAILAAAKGMAESSGGMYTPGSGANESYNAFGFGCSDKKGLKCKKYTGFDDAIQVVIYNLSGNNPKTAKYYGRDLTIAQKVNNYNPPKVVEATYGDPAWYLNKIKRIMSQIDSMDVSDSSGQLASK